MNKNVIWQTEAILIRGSIYGIRTNKHHRFEILKTCSACPEQYDIRFVEINKKFYGRLRWGYFYVAEEPLGKPIYEYKFTDEWSGQFSSPYSEMKHLMRALEKIIKKYPVKKHARKNN